MQHLYNASVTRNGSFYIMPSHRKRIGFLPREEVHNIIEELCIKHKFSQSKVTGILVEEALFKRGIIGNIDPKMSNHKNVSNEKLTKHNSSFIGNELSNSFSNSFGGESIIKSDLNMINEFIEYKIFKKIMKKNEKLIN